jgi:capsular polysaccharide biosynthesis protein
MIVLQKSASDQTFSFMPRSYTSGTTYTIKIINETTNKEVYSDTTTSFTLVKYYYQYTDTFTLLEDTLYTLEITAGSDVIYRDKIFCTNQTVSSYSVNNNAYTEQSQDNEFIVL